MNCTVCDHPNVEGAPACIRCATPLPSPHPGASGGAPGGAGSGGAGSASETRLPPAGASATRLPEPHAPDPRASHPAAPVTFDARPGATPPGLLGPRYEILRLLGQGGMGAVYLAEDRELRRQVAVKVIAPHLAGEAWVVERFKREIQLSSLVTHPSVLRVFDLGEHEGLKFLTMQYIEGRTLADVIREERPLSIDRAVEIFRQICAGLGAAHAKGVLHRDLKPQNVMVDGEGRAYVTDFGLATSADAASLTRTGALMGTPHYMSPEQVKGEPVDARSDVFSAGVLFHEMLTGSLPFTGNTAYEVMVARTRAVPRRACDVNPAVPARVQRVLDACLEIGRERRLPSMAAVLAELDALDDRRRARRVRRQLRVTTTAAAIAAGVLALAVAGPLLAWRLWPRHGAPTPQTVLVADFENRTGDSVFDGTLEPALGLALEGASFVTTYNRTAARRTADRLKLAGEGLGEARARLVAQREGIAVVAAGTVERAGGGFRIGVRAVDAVTGRLVHAGAEEAAKDGVLAAAAKLAAKVRSALGDATSESVQLAAAETFSAASLDAAHEYALGASLAAEGSWDDARKHYLAAVALDPGLGRAYSGLGVLEYNSGRPAEAERWFRQALAHLDRMTDREKHRTRGAYYLTVNRDPVKAIEALRALVDRYPSDHAALTNLALAHVLNGEYARALELQRRAVAAFPTSVPQRNNLGFYAMYAGAWAEAIREQQKTLELSPRFVNGHIGLALAQLGAGERDAAIATWERLRALGADGAAAAVEGLADLALVEGRLADARALLEPGAAADRAAGERDAQGRKLAMLASLHLAAGDVRRATEAAERAVGASRSEPVVFSAGLALAEAGKEARARALADELDHRLGPAPRMYAEVLRSAVELRRRNRPEAIAHAKAALQRLDAWIARFALGRAYLAAGAWPEAQDELERCDRRRGEATDAFVENVPTFRFQAEVRLLLARAEEGLGNPAAAAEDYRAFLAQKRSDEDAQVRDARARLRSP